MTEHDRIRKVRAENCDRADLNSLSDAIRGLQSTDDPSLASLHNELQIIEDKLRSESKSMMWDRPLTDQEVKILYDNPHDIFGLATRPEESKCPDLWEGFVDPSGKGVWHKIDGIWKLTGESKRHGLSDEQIKILDEEIRNDPLSLGYIDTEEK